MEALDESHGWKPWMKALADPVRVRLLSFVATAPVGEVCACDFPATLGTSQPTLSHHLSQMVTAGILHREQRDKRGLVQSRRARLAERHAPLADTTDGQAA